MFSDTDVEPALTQGEWQKSVFDGRAEDANWHFAEMARHNAALPDSDRRKLTRHDIATLKYVSERLLPVPAAEALYNKLRALLPPE